MSEEMEEEEAQRAKGVLHRRATAVSQVTSAQRHQAERLCASHSKVREQLRGARGAIAFGAVADVPARRSKFPLLTRLHPLRHTAIYDRGWVARQLTDGASIGINTYLWEPAYRRIDPHPLFAAAEYLDRYPDVAEAGMSPFQHYLQYGWREGRDPHVYFANDWYLQQYPDVLKSELNPLEHYLRNGWREGRKPNPVFDPAAYLDRHEDVRRAGVEPLSHYIAYGRFEGREVPFEGLERTWRSVVPTSGVTSLMDYLLFEEVVEPPSVTSRHTPSLGGARHEGWPPTSLNGFWLPLGVHDFLVGSHREEALPLYEFLYSVMDAYSDAPETFPASKVCMQILDRVRTLSRQLASSEGKRPDASIIIPAYNNFLDTLLCLTSILESESASSFEIIIADDGSSDATAEILPSIGGVVRHLRQPRNLGFLNNCNVAAETAQGTTIVLLNNDTLVLPNWLDALLAPLHQPEPVGFVGSKLICWDGTLQEAGGIFWRDGSAWNFGRGQNPLAPEFNYLKDVDYCSGASIAVPAALWRQLDGFDRLYSPAYCEDADLAFRVREAGYKVLYTPSSEVIHHEGRSHGRDTDSGIKSYQVESLARLRDRWDKVLVKEHFPNGQNALVARDRSRDRIHVLVIDHYVPTWDQDAGSRSMYQYLEIFLDLGFQVTFWPDNLHRDPIYAPALQALGVEVIYGPRFVDGFESFMVERGGLYDAVLLSRPEVADRYLSLIRKHSVARVLFYGHDLHFRRMEAGLNLGLPVDRQRIEEMKHLELRICGASDVVFYPDPDEVAFIADHVPSAVVVLPNPVFVFDEAEIESNKARLPMIGKQGHHLLFVGGFNHEPNREGLAWFIADVFPRVVDRVPDVTLKIAGSNPTPDVTAMSSDRVAILGRVSDEELDGLYDECAVAIAPLRYGAGVKGKVIEAMARGVPVVTTPTGAQGISSPYDALFIGETAQDMAEELVRALIDREEAARRAGQGLKFIKRHYGRSALSEVFWRLIVDDASA